MGGAPTQGEGDHPPPAAAARTATHRSTAHRARVRRAVGPGIDLDRSSVGSAHPRAASRRDRRPARKPETERGPLESARPDGALKNADSPPAHFSFSKGSISTHAPPETGWRAGSQPTKDDRPASPGNDRRPAPGPRGPHPARRSCAHASKGKKAREKATIPFDTCRARWLNQTRRQEEEKSAHQGAAAQGHRAQGDSGPAAGTASGA